MDRCNALTFKVFSNSTPKMGFGCVRRATRSGESVSRGLLSRALNITAVIVLVNRL